MGLLDLFQRSSGPHPSKDELVVEQLRQHGSDLSKPHQIDFFFYLRDRGRAEEFAEMLRRDGFEADARASAEGSSYPYCVAAQKSMTPQLPQMEALTVRFENLMADYGGKYDGWGTEVVP